MFDSPALRLLTALLVATWSPGSWCCCAGQEAGPALEAATVAAVESGESQGSCCSATEQADAPAAEPTSAPCSGADECCPLDPRGPSSCGCLHAAHAAALLGAKPALAGQPATADLDMLGELSPLMAGAGVTTRRPSACRGSPLRPPPPTLLSLRCMLTT